MPSLCNENELENAMISVQFIAQKISNNLRNVILAKIYLQFLSIKAYGAEALKHFLRMQEGYWHLLHF